MTREEREIALYCLKASSDYHSEVCEECIKYSNCDHTMQDDVTETIVKALEQEPSWIPVSERLPASDEDVLVTTKHNIITIGYIHPDDKVWVTDTVDMFGRVTAWMPLPEPYKAESEGKE